MGIINDFLKKDFSQLSLSGKVFSVIVHALAAIGGFVIGWGIIEKLLRMGGFS